VRSGVRFYSFLEPSGYAMAALAHLRGLVNAGIAVQWTMLAHRDSGIRVLPTGLTAIPEFAAGDAALADLAALAQATALPVAHDRVVACTVPELWPQLFDPRCRAIGCTVWETDRLPPHWRGSLACADRIIVPSEHNRVVFERDAPGASISVVPHMRRHAFNDYSADEIAQVRRAFGIDGARTVFYSINAWDPRKDLATLLRAFVRAFTRDDPVALVLKTPPLGYGAPPYYRREPAGDLARAAIDAEAQALGRAAPAITLLPYEMSGRGVDVLHSIGDAYVSTTHSEGFGLGAFDAAARGRPVLMTGWGGQRDYLGDDSAWPGALPSRMTSVPVWPPDAPSYWRSQRWASVDVDVVAHALRAYVADPAPHLAAAERIAERIANDFAEPVVAARFVDAVFADS
jgi:glycosyltransferase involved in cell wall biosynthesis